MFKKILVAVDGSDHSKRALDHALELAKRFDGKVTLINVYSTVVPISPAMDTLSTPPTIPPHASPEVAAKLTEEAKQKGERILEEAERVAKERGILADKVLREGDAVREIVDVAQDGKFDLVVVGHKGLSRLRELFMGAVSEGVSHKAPCPVLIVK
jgi:nucleotide-binding universal stress UspA family protein